MRHYRQHHGQKGLNIDTARAMRMVFDSDSESFSTISTSISDRTSQIQSAESSLWAAPAYIPNTPTHSSTTSMTHSQWAATAYVPTTTINTTISITETTLHTQTPKIHGHHNTYQSDTPTRMQTFPSLSPIQQIHTHSNHTMNDTLLTLIQ